MELENKYDFDVAFSFTHQDEGIAYAINDLIQDRFKTFIYSEQQKMLAGTDGEKTFNDVFSEKARIVVVLYRDNWGTTPWTRIEETAIRNRGHEEGYDFTTFVQLDSNSKMPKWLAKNRIYYNFERWGIKGLAPVIEARIQEAGGQSHPESIEDQAARNKRELLARQKRKEYLGINGEGYSAAFAEVKKLFSDLESKTKSLEDPDIDMRFGYTRDSGRRFAVRCETYSLHFSWECQYSNSLHDSCLYVALTTFKGIYPPLRDEKVLTNSEYQFDINIATEQTGWSLKQNEEEFITSEQLMDKWLRLFLDKVKKAKVERHKQW